MQGPFVTTDDRADLPLLRISAGPLSRAQAGAIAASPREIGGILVGWWEGEGRAVVHDLLPVPDHYAGHTHYARRHSPAQQQLDDFLRRESVPNAGYIGEWHSHPAPQPPSAIDRGALKDIVRQVRGPVALVVLSLTSGGVVQAHGLLGRPRWLRRAAVEHASIERMSS